MVHMHIMYNTYTYSHSELDYNVPPGGGLQYETDGDARRLA